jgi:hypothetical protein
MPSDRSFGFTFVVIFALIAAWQTWIGHMRVALAFAVMSAVVLLVSMLRPVLLHKLNVAWMKLAEILHRVVSPIVLGGMYFVVITPFAVVMRLFGRDALQRRLDPQARTYWIERNPPGPAPDSLPHQF